MSKLNKMALRKVLDGLSELEKPYLPPEGFDFRKSSYPLEMRLVTALTNLTHLVSDTLEALEKQDEPQP